MGVLNEIKGIEPSVAMQFIPHDDLPVYEYVPAGFPTIAYYLKKKYPDREIGICGNVDGIEEAMDNVAPATADDMKAISSKLIRYYDGLPPLVLLVAWGGMVPGHSGPFLFILDHLPEGDLPEDAFCFPYKKYFIVMNYPVPQDRIDEIKITPEMAENAYGDLETAIKMLDKAKGIRATGDLFVRLRREGGGTFHTPFYLAKYLLETELRPGMRVLDPSCGTGSFVLAALSIQRDTVITAVDIDPIAVKATEINVRLMYDMEIETKVADFLIDNVGSGYDLAIGNPPWISIRDLGGKYSDIVSKLGYHIKKANVPNVDISAIFAVKASRIAKRVVFLMPRSSKFSVIFAPMREMLDCEFEDVDTPFPVKCSAMKGSRKRPGKSKGKRDMPYYYGIAKLGADIVREPFLDQNGEFRAARKVLPDGTIEIVHVSLPIYLYNGKYRIKRGTKPEIVKTIDFFGKLTTPDQRAPYRVVYNVSANRVIAAILDDPDVIVSNYLVYIPCQSKEEAEYLMDILNSDELNEFVDSIRDSTRGHISKRALLYPIKKYSKTINLGDLI